MQGTKVAVSLSSLQMHDTKVAVNRTSLEMQGMKVQVCHTPFFIGLEGVKMKVGY